MRHKRPPAWQDGSWPEMERLEQKSRQETRFLGLTIGIGMLTIGILYLAVMLVK